MLNRRSGTSGVLFLTFIFLMVGPCAAQSALTGGIPSLLYRSETGVKAIAVRVLFRDERRVEVQSTRVVDGPARTMVHEPPFLRLHYVVDGITKHMLNAPSPLYWRQYKQARPQEEHYNGGGITHKTIKRNNSSLRVVIPFYLQAENLTIYDNRNGNRLISVDLKSAVRNFCRTTVSFPGCDAINNPVVEPTPDKPDLVIKYITGTDPVHSSGETVNNVQITVENLGRSRASGTVDEPNTGYTVDLVLSSDQQIPVRPASFSQFFREDALLRGARVTDTKSINFNEYQTYTVQIHIPADTPAGTYCLGAVVDPANGVREGKEDNNTKCREIFIGRP